MDKERIQKQTGKKMDEAMEAAGVKAPRVMKSILMQMASVTVDHERDQLTVEIRDGGKYVPLDKYIESLRYDSDFANCFELRPHPSTERRPYEVKAAEGLRAGDLEAIADGRAVLTGWRREQTEVVELGENEIAASDKAGVAASIEEIASGEKTIRFDV